MTQKERIEQLEAEVEKLKVLLSLALGLGGSAVYVLHNDSERWNGLCKYMAHMGLSTNTEFEINGDGVTVICDGKEISEWSLKGDSHET